MNWSRDGYIIPIIIIYSNVRLPDGSCLSIIRFENNCSFSTGINTRRLLENFKTCDKRFSFFHLFREHVISNNYQTRNVRPSTRQNETLYYFSKLLCSLHLKLSSNGIHSQRSQNDRKSLKTKNQILLPKK